MTAAAGVLPLSSDAAGGQRQGRVDRLDVADEVAVRRLAEWFARASDEATDDPPAEVSLAEVRSIRARIRSLHGRYPWAVVEALAGADWETFHRLVEDLGIDRAELARAVGRALGTPRERVEEVLERRHPDGPAPTGLALGAHRVLRVLVDNFTADEGARARRWRAAGDFPEKSFYRAVKALVEAGYIAREGRRYTPTERGLAAAADAAGRAGAPGRAGGDREPFGRPLDGV